MNGKEAFFLGISLGIGIIVGEKLGDYILNRERQDEEDYEQLVLDYGSPGEVVYDDLPETNITSVKTNMRHSKESEEGVNIFLNKLKNWDWDKELSERDPSKPYIIHEDEYAANELGFTQVTMMYYEGDNILVGPDEIPIYKHETVTGPLLFGHGSSVDSIVFVRNESLSMDMEILKDEDSYMKDSFYEDYEDDPPEDKIKKFKEEE